VILKALPVSAHDNPFRGMNPFFQNRWPDAHTRLIANLADALNGELPDDLTAQAEEGVRVAGESRTMRADVAVVESWQRGFPPVWQPESAASGNGGVALAVTEPHIVEDEEPARWIEIRALSGDLISVIDLRSPTNKLDERVAYLDKRERYRRGGVKVVEIDLVRGGDPLTLVPERWRRDWREQGHRLDYEVAVWRACIHRLEVYPISLREALPTLRIPLRATDPDVPLALQALVDRCHVNGRYWQLSDLATLRPPLSEDDAAWARTRLAGAA
jgi:hypothetical protein